MTIDALGKGGKDIREKLGDGIGGVEEGGEDEDGVFADFFRRVAEEFE